MQRKRIPSPIRYWLAWRLMAEAERAYRATAFGPADKARAAARRARRLDRAARGMSPLGREHRITFDLRRDMRRQRHHA